jgi:MFS family permease
MNGAVARRVLPVIVVSQFAGTSLWFAVNAVLPELQRAWALPPEALAPLTSSVQLGFVAGTLVSALLMLADRFRPTRVFLACCLLAAGCNAAIATLDGQFGVLLALRFAVGFLLAAAGGLLTAWLVPDRAPAGGVPIRLRSLVAIWSERRLRASVFGYFGHMWELYTLYALLPLVIATRLQGQQVSVTAFWAIAAGALGCAGGGLLARRVGSARVAQWQLAASGLCCLAAPAMLTTPAALFIAWLLLWGTTVVGDSPQFSALTARNAPAEAVGSVLVFTNCIGFAISVASIELFVRLAQNVSLAWLLPWLGVGPALGLLALRPLLRGHRPP